MRGRRGPLTKTQTAALQIHSLGTRGGPPGNDGCGVAVWI